VICLFKSGSVCDESTSEDVDGVEEIHSVATINNVQTSYFTQLKMCYLMTQERSGLFHSWYTDPSLQGKGEQCNSQVSHHRPYHGREPRHRLGQGKSGRQRGTATDQMDKRGTLDQEDTDVHESGCRILPTQPHMGPGDFQVTCSIEL